MTLLYVSGVIDLQPSGEMNEWYIGKDKAYAALAGQTSPGSVTRAGKHNEDTLTLSSSRNFILDHCDFSGARDETLDLGSNHHWTVQWCMVANSSEGQT